MLLALPRAELRALYIIIFILTGQTYQGVALGSTGKPLSMSISSGPGSITPLVSLNLFYIKTTIETAIKN